MGTIASHINKDPYVTFTSKGIHHNCQFDIHIAVPSLVLKMMNVKHGINYSGSDYSDLLNQLCIEAIAAPGTIMSSAIRVGGEAIEIPYDRQYDSFQTTFYVDGGSQGSGGLTYKLFQTWLDTIYPPSTRNFAYPEDYITTVKLSLYTMPNGYSLGENNHAFNIDKQSIITMNYVESWPASIQSLNLTGRSGSTPSEFSVTWKYRYCVTGSNDDISKAAVANLIQSDYKLIRQPKRKPETVTTQKQQDEENV